MSSPSRTRTWRTRGWTDLAANGWLVPRRAVPTLLRRPWMASRAWRLFFLPSLPFPLPHPAAVGGRGATAQRFGGKGHPRRDGTLGGPQPLRAATRSHLVAVGPYSAGMTAGQRNPPQASPFACVHAFYEQTWSNEPGIHRRARLILEASPRRRWNRLAIHHLFCQETSSS